MGKIAIIGGSGIKDSPLFEGVEWETFHTWFNNGHGDGRVEYQERDSTIFIPRHGRDDGLGRFGPSCTQYAANIIAASKLGASVIVATSAVGSLQENIPVKSLVVPHDYIDESWRNPNLFGVGIVNHGSPRPAFSKEVREALLKCGADYLRSVSDEPGHFVCLHEGVYVTIPGDPFGTDAEGKKRSAYADIVGETGCPEASMAMQAGLHYAVAAFPVDMDRDANHEGGTLKIMGEMSRFVPSYISDVVNELREFAQDPPIVKNLVGNIIPGDTNRIRNHHLKDIADKLIETYCG